MAEQLFCWVVGIVTGYLLRKFTEAADRPNDASQPSPTTKEQAK